MFKEGVRFTEESDIGEVGKKRKYMYFDQLLFHLPHIEYRETQGMLNTLNNEEESNNSQEEEEEEEEEEEKERPRNIRKRSELKFPTRIHYCSFCGRKN